MSGRIKEMRKALYDHLVSLKTPGNWEHILNQIGMFSYTGMSGNYYCLNIKNILIIIVFIFDILRTPS